MTKTHKHTINGKKTKEYTAWTNMKQRCTNKKVASWPDYGGRGITICDEWLVYENFLKDMGLAPGSKFEIDRIDNNKGYSKENCRWTTNPINQRNKRTVSKTGFKGVSLSNGRYQAQISVNNKIHYIGKFKTAYLAHLAYEACREVIETSRVL